MEAIAGAVVYGAGAKKRPQKRETVFVPLTTTTTMMIMIGNDNCEAAF